MFIKPLNQQCVHLIVNNSEPTLNSGVYEGRSDRGPLIQEIIIPDGQNFESQVGCLLRISNIPGRFRPKMLVPKPLILSMISFIMELS